MTDIEQTEKAMNGEKPAYPGRVEPLSQPLLFSLGEIAKTTETQPKAGTPEATLDKYLARTIRRVTLFFTQAEYDEVIKRAKRVCKKLEVDNHTDCFKRLICERDEA